jgi:HEAT repeat protein
MCALFLLLPAALLTAQAASNEDTPQWNDEPGQQSQESRPGQQDEPSGDGDSTQQPEADQPEGDQPEAAGSQKQNQSENQSQESSEAESGEQQSPVERYREVIRFGIDKELLDLISSLEERNETRVNDELAGRFGQTQNQELKKEILDFFVESEFTHETVTKHARDLVKNLNTNQVGVVRSAVTYLTKTMQEPGSETLDVVRDLIKRGPTQLANAGVRGLGRVGTQSDIDFLLKKLQDRRTPQPVRNTIVLALGDLKAQAAVDTLIEIAEDDDNPQVMRRYAVDSLGKIGAEKAVPVLTKLLGTQQSMLRAYAVSALGNFQGQQVTDRIIGALRDSYAPARIHALKAVAEHKIVDAFPAVRYKARNDPEANVRAEAIRTMSKIGTDDAVKELSDILTSKSSSARARTTAATMLIDDHLSNSVAVNAVKKVVQEEWQARESRLLQHIGKELSTASDAKAASELLGRFLQHRSSTIKIYGIRGITASNLSGYSGDIEKLTDSSQHPAVKREAEQAVEQLE